MRGRKFSPQIIIAVGIGAVILVVVAVVLTGGSNIKPGPGLAVQIPSEDHGFPKLQFDPRKDTVQLPHQVWSPITVNAATCTNWVLYHHKNNDGTWNIFRVTENGGQSEKPTNVSKGTGSNVSDIAPSRSPDGQWVAFASNRDNDHWEIYVSSIDGAKMQRLTYTTWAVDINPMWSPAGGQLAYESTRNGNWDLYTADLKTGEEARITYYPANNLNAYWSSDGSKILFQSDRDGKWQIYETNVTDAAKNQDENAKLLSDTKGDDTDPAYSPDSKYISFSSVRDGKNSMIYLMNTDGSNMTTISDPNGSAANQVWSPDSKLIAYQARINGTLNVYIYDMQTKKTRILTQNKVNSYAPTWLCDSPSIAFTSDVADNISNIFMAPALPIDTPAIDVQQGAKRLTFDPTANQYPQNSPSKENASRRGLPAPKAG